MKLYAVYLKRYIQGYKLRSAMLVFSVMISVLFITFIGILTDSIHATDIENRYSRYGEFQGMVAGLSSSGREMAEKEDKLKERAYSEACGYVQVGSEIAFLGDMDQSAMKLAHLVLTSGRWPQNTDEISMQDTTLKNMGLDVETGDKISLDVTVYGREQISSVKKEYTLVGIFKNNALQSAIKYSNGILDINALGTVMPSLIITQEAVSEFGKDYIVQKNLLFTLKDTKNAEETMNSLALGGTLLPNVLYIHNHDESWTQRDQNTNAEGTILIILTILFTLVGTINSFFITVQEREHQIGILRALGAKKSQIRMIIMNEAATISLLAIPMGVLSAVGLIRVVLNIVQSICGQIQIMQIKTSTIILCVTVSVLSVMIAAFFPATRATYVSPISAIMGQNAAVIQSSSFQLSNTETSLPVKGGITYQMAIRNLRRQKKRSIPVAIVVFLAVITSIFSYNMSHVFTLDLNRYMNKGTYAYHLSGNSALVTGKVSPEGGLSTDDVEKLRVTSGVGEVDAYKILIGAVCGIPSANLNELSKNMADYLLDNSTMSGWQQEAAELFDSSIQPVNIRIIGVEEHKLEEMLPDTDVGDFESALLYVPPYGRNGEIITDQVIGLHEDDSVKLVWYKNQGSNNWDTMDVRVESIIHSLPSDMAKEPDIGESMCILINEKYFSQLTNESLFNSVYVYTEPDVSFGKLEESINTIANNGKSITVESKMDEIKEFINNSKMMTAKLFSTSIIVILLALLIIFYTVFSAVLVRKHEIGMLRAVGMTKKQLIRMVCAENTFICLIAALCGTLTVFPLVTGAIKVEGLSVWNNVPWLFLLSVLIVSFLVAAVISLFAIRIVMKNGIMNAIRQVE